MSTGDYYGLRAKCRAEKNLIDRYRRFAAKRGWRVKKSRTINTKEFDHGGLMLLDQNNTVLYGWHYDLQPQQLNGIFTGISIAETIQSRKSQVSQQARS